MPGSISQGRATLGDLNDRAAESVPLRLPRSEAVDRARYLVALADGERVVHVGFAGESRADVSRLIGRHTWLHGRLAAVASEIVGVDIDPDAVERARALGFEAHSADAGDPEALRALGVQGSLVVAGEVIEHMEHPGVFLDAMHELAAPGGRLVVTTPNAASLLNPAAAMIRRELINPDHVAFYSWYTLTNLMARHDWSIEAFATYHFPFADEAWRGGAATGAARALTRLQALAARAWPFLDFGLIAVASSSRGARSSG